MKRFSLFAIIALVLAGGSFAQATLTKSSTLPTLDGVIGASEYQYSGTVSGMKIAATLGANDVFYLAVEGPTAGYVASGVGGLVMNGSRLFFGATQDGKPAFLEKAGVGHFYGDAKELVVTKWAVKTVGNDTVLELSMPAGKALWKGQINAIFAYSKSPTFSSKHVARGALTFTVK